MKRKLRNIRLKEISKRVKFFYMNLSMMLMISYPVYASAGEPDLINGTRKLVAAGTALVTGLVAAVSIWKAATVGIQWINASAEEKPKFQKELIQVIIATVVTLTIGGTITWIIGFYNV